MHEGSAWHTVYPRGRGLKSAVSCGFLRLISAQSCGPLGAVARSCGQAATKARVALNCQDQGVLSTASADFVQVGRAKRLGSLLAGVSRGGCMAAKVLVWWRQEPPCQPGCPCLPPTRSAAGCYASMTLYLTTSAFKHSK